MSLATINSNIKRVAKTGAALNTLIQGTAVLCVEHAVETGDANPAMRLVQAVQPRLRRPLVLWFAAYSRINVVPDKDKGYRCSISKADDRVDNLDGARVNPWYETEAAQREDLPATLDDLNDGVVSFIKRQEKKLTDGRVLAADVDAFTARLTTLKAAMAA